MKKALVLSFACLTSLHINATTTTNASAGQKWYGPYTITKVARFWDGGGRATIHFAEVPTDVPCTVTQNKKQATYWFGPNSHDFADSMFSAAAAAQAQNKKVYVLLDNKCHATYGLNLHGVEISSN